MQFIEKVILSLGKSSSYVFTNWEEQTVHNPQKYAKIDKYVLSKIPSTFTSKREYRTIQITIWYKSWKKCLSIFTNR